MVSAIVSDRCKAILAQVCTYFKTIDGNNRLKEKYVLVYFCDVDMGSKKVDFIHGKWQWHAEIARGGERRFFVPSLQCRHL